ncbi:MAG: FAD-dependent oxidoreductase, partial [Actinobacteria bacterium]|nr:FAD-dependent oxidoreductase [Actinomycetota bacterium]
MQTGKKVIIIGGVAAGTSAAARLRRMTEDIEITLYEKYKYISYATCGLPYFVSGKIQNVNELLVST